MSMFVNPQAELSVSDEKGNTIYIKAHMDFADNAKIEAAFMQLKLKNRQAQNGAARPQEDADMDIDATVAISAQHVALLETNIKRWEGPDFEGVPCTRANIKLLNPNEPLVVKVLEKINEQNNPPTEAPPVQKLSDPNIQGPSIYEA